MQKYTYIYWIHTDAINKQTQEDFFNKIFTSHFFARIRKGFYCERELEIEHDCNILTPNFYGRQRCVFLVLLMLNRRSWGPLCWVLAFFAASYQHLLWTPTHQGPKPLRPGVAFPTTSLLSPSPTLLQLAVELNSTQLELS